MENNNNKIENNISIRIKPIVSYWKSGDPCKKINIWKDKLTDINIINTKNITDEFINICIENKNKIYLHINITGMGQTRFEPNIPTVKYIFFVIKKLIDLGFPQKQILVIVNPILPNDNGLNALKLLLKLFTEYKFLRLRFVRFNVLQYYVNENNQKIIKNKNITNRNEIKPYLNYLINSDSFWKDYYKLLDEYKSIVSVDSGDEALIGVRELMAFSINNEWINSDNTRDKIIHYEKGNKYKPIVNLLSEKKAIRCSNRCLLCSWFY